MGENRSSKSSSKISVINNDKYHSRQTDELETPTYCWKKQQIQEWLQKKEITSIENETINNSRNVVKHVKNAEEFLEIDFGELSSVVEDFKINLTDSDNVVSDKNVNSSESSEEISTII